ncbi:MAG: hypothetical protein ACXV5H_09810 [Halobacteriota archaeon]
MVSLLAFAVHVFVGPVDSYCFSHISTAPPNDTHPVTLTSEEDGHGMLTANFTQATTWHMCVMAIAAHPSSRQQVCVQTVIRQLIRSLGDKRGCRKASLPARISAVRSPASIIVVHML